MVYWHSRKAYWPTKGNLRIYYFMSSIWIQTTLPLHTIFEQWRWFYDQSFGEISSLLNLPKWKNFSLKKILSYFLQIKMCHYNKVPIFMRLYIFKSTRLFVHSNYIKFVLLTSMYNNQRLIKNVHSGCFKQGTVMKD